MMITAVMFSLLRAAVCGRPVSEGVKAACTAENLDAVYTLAGRHDLAHLVGQSVSKLELPESEALSKCQMAAKQAIFRYVRLDLVYTQLCDTLEKAEIPFIPLKGSVLRAWYPEPWMRTSCDIDVLVREEYLEQAANVLKKELKYIVEDKGDHDVSLFSSSGVHLELHYDMIVESDAINQSHRVLSQVWEDAKPKSPGACFYSLSDAMFYFYHIAHMAKHLENGGCGIRPFLDLWILNHRVEHDAAQRKRLLAEGGLLNFAETAEKLSEVWFSQAETDSLTAQLEHYILSGGVYGTLKNSVAMKQVKKGGKWQYALGRIFLPYDTIKFYYPILQKHRCLLPVYQVVRWCKLLFKGGVKRSVHELKVNAATSRGEGQLAAELLVKLGLE